MGLLAVSQACELEPGTGRRLLEEQEVLTMKEDRPGGGWMGRRRDTAQVRLHWPGPQDVLCGGRACREHPCRATGQPELRLLAGLGRFS